MIDGALESEEGHVVVAGGLEGCGCALHLGDVSAGGSVDEALVGAALLPDAGVDAAFDEDGAVVVGNDVDVAGECGDGGVPGALPAGIVSWRCGGGEGGGFGGGWGGVRLWEGEGGEGGGCGGRGGEVEEMSAGGGAVAQGQGGDKWNASAVDRR